MTRLPYKHKIEISWMKNRDRLHENGAPITDKIDSGISCDGITLIVDEMVKDGVEIKEVLRFLYKDSYRDRQPFSWSEDRKKHIKRLMVINDA